MMKAIGFKESLPATDPRALEEITVPTPTPGPHDLLVEIKAVSVNPVDTKVRLNAPPNTGHKILGFDASGIVRAVGEQVSLFEPGDEVFYAGNITRPGTNAELHLVDERIVGLKPTSLSFAEAAALPLTAITAWEMLFDCFRIPMGGGEGDSLLVIGGAGGVGSILVQLAKVLTQLNIVATASREETNHWVHKMGADAVINHHKSLSEQVAQLGLSPRYVAALTKSDLHFESIVDLIAPRGEITMIDDPGILDFGKMKRKSLSFHWEFMFTRPVFETADRVKQHHLLKQVAELVDENRILTTLTDNQGPMSAEKLRAAHQRQESGQVIGKIVLQGIS